MNPQKYPLTVPAGNVTGTANRVAVFDSTGRLNTDGDLTYNGTLLHGVGSFQWDTATMGFTFDETNGLFFLDSGTPSAFQMNNGLLTINGDLSFETGNADTFILANNTVGVALGSVAGINGIQEINLLDEIELTGTLHQHDGAVDLFSNSHIGLDCESGASNIFMDGSSMDFFSEGATRFNALSFQVKDTTETSFLEVNENECQMRYDDIYWYITSTGFNIDGITPTATVNSPNWSIPVQIGANVYEWLLFKP